MNYWYSGFKIRDLEVPRFVSGPLDGYTDSAYRQLVRRYCPDTLVYSEMRHTASVASDEGGSKALKLKQTERPLSFQISANSVDFIDQAIDKILQTGVDCVDLNVGCPARSVVKSGAGSELMADMPTLESIVKRIRERLPIAFTVKMRAGFKKKNAEDVAQMLWDNGVDMIAIHPRLQTARHSGELDFELVRKIKNKLSIPIIFSGNVVTIDDARNVYEKTGVDGYLIGRGAQGKPWRLAQLQAEAEGRNYVITQKEVIECALEHLNLLINHYGDKQGLFHFRKHIPFYIHDFPQAATIRRELLTEESFQVVHDNLKQLSI